MKYLYLIRHAKSSWDDASLTDFERPLNKRGFRDCINMPNYLFKNKVKFDYILSSSALRAKTTALKFNEVFKLPESKISFTKEIYHAYNNTVIDLVKTIDNEINHLAVFGHNPTFTSLANNLSDLTLDNLPTCGVVCISFKIDDWNKIDEQNGKFEFLEIPKNLK